MDLPHPAKGRVKNRARSPQAKRMSPSTTLQETLDRYSDGPKTGVFTDGACSGNPGPGGWGAVYVVDDAVVDQRYGHDPDTTNNRMELTALVEGYEMIPPDLDICIYTDSRLCVNTN